LYTTYVKRDHLQAALAKVDVVNSGLLDEQRVRRSTVVFLANAYRENISLRQLQDTIKLNLRLFVDNAQVRAEAVATARPISEIIETLLQKDRLKYLVTLDAGKEMRRWKKRAKKGIGAKRLVPPSKTLSALSMYLDEADAVWILPFNQHLHPDKGYAESSPTMRRVGAHEQHELSYFPDTGIFLFSRSDLGVERFGDQEKPQERDF
jgi:hypothetical protein